jgi:hypothetical protein
MKHTPDPSDFDQLRKHVISLFPEQPDSPVVPAAQQEEEIHSISRTIGGERFYFVVDMTSFEISQSGGIQRWLGYYEKEFTLKKYWGLVHPGLQKAAHAVFLQMANILCTGKFDLAFMVQRYSSLTAIKHTKGHYLLLKRTASVFQYDTRNRLTAYLNEFTIIGQYNGEPLSPSFFTDKGEQETERGDIIMKKVLENFLGMKVFSVKELQVARMLVYQPGISQQQIADTLDVLPSTIVTYYRRFLQKAREYFHHDFSSALEAAIYLQKAGLL